MLSQTIINLSPNDSETQRLLEYPYRFHHVLEDINTARQRLLWRFAHQRLLIRHSQPLDWNRLDQRFPRLGQRTHSHLQNTPKVGDYFAFNLLAYIRRRPVTGPWIVQEPDQYREWLQRQSAAVGFDVKEISRMSQSSTYVRTSSMGLNIQPVEIIGQLEVSDVASFTQTLEKGLGRMRAFGCGLLLIK